MYDQTTSANTLGAQPVALTVLRISFAHSCCFTVIFAIKSSSQAPSDMLSNLLAYYYCSIPMWDFTKSAKKKDSNTTNNASNSVSYPFPIESTHVSRTWPYRKVRACGSIPSTPTVVLTS